MGPRASAESLGTDVVVAVDGVRDPEPLLAVATAWATQLGSGLRIVTVYEPVLADLDQPAHYTRHHGPAGDPDNYVKSVRERVADFPFAVDAVAIADPVAVADGLEQHLVDVPARILVLGGRHGEPPGPSGGIARHLLRNVTLPVLVVNHSDADAAVNHHDRRLLRLIRDQWIDDAETLAHAARLSSEEASAALNRLRERALLETSSGPGPGGRRTARFRLTATGHAALGER